MLRMLATLVLMVAICLLGLWMALLLYTHTPFSV